MGVGGEGHCAVSCLYLAISSLYLAFPASSCCKSILNAYKKNVGFSVTMHPCLALRLYYRRAGSSACSKLYMVLQVGTPRTHRKFLNRDDGSYGPIPARRPLGMLGMPFNSTAIKVTPPPPLPLLLPSQCSIYLAEKGMI